MVDTRILRYALECGLSEGFSKIDIEMYGFPNVLQGFEETLKSEIEEYSGAAMDEDTRKILEIFENKIAHQMTACYNRIFEAARSELIKFCDELADELMLVAETAK